jgi:ankyrin repeat protein
MTAENEFTTLREAAARGDARRVAELCRSGVDPQLCNENGWTALHEAASKGHLEVVQALLEAGADAEAKTDGGFAAVRYANDAAVKELLLGSGRSQAERDALALLVACETRDRTRIEGLLAKGADINGWVEAEQGRTTPFLTGISCRRLGEAAHSYAEWVRELVLCGGDAAAVESCGYPALHLVISSPANTAEAEALGQLVRFMLDHGADIHSVDPDGQTVLWRLRAQVEEYFLPSLTLARSLVEFGVDLNHRDGQGTTYYEAVVADGNVELARFVRPQPPPKCRLLVLSSVRNDSAGMVRFLAESGEDLDAADETGRTALIRCVEVERHEALAELIRAGADLNRQDQNGRTALHHAAERADEKSARLLLEAGANRDIQDDLGQDFESLVDEYELTAMRDLLDELSRGAPLA